MGDDTFGLSNNNTIPPEPLSSSQPTMPSTLVTPSTPEPTPPTTLVTPSTPEATTPPNSLSEEPQIPNIDQELEKQLSSIPATDSSPKKFPVKIVAIILVVLLAGAAAAYFLLRTDSVSTTETAPNDPPPSVTNPFASPATDTPSVETDIPTQDGPPSLDFPTPTPTPDETELKTTVDELKETSDSAANVTDVTTIENSEKIAR
ncbi:MAG: hypothetical protein WCX95_01135 [Candidatus Gracilibacteria bacterium]